MVALVASIVVTSAVAGPMAYQANQANQTGGSTTPSTFRTSTTTTRPPTPTLPPSVLPETEVREPSIAVGAPTTEERTSPTTGARTPPAGTAGRTNTTRPATTAPASTSPGSSAPPATDPSVAPTPTTVPTVAVIVWTRTWQARSATPVAGAVVTGSVVIYLSDVGAPGVTTVRFWMDDPAGAGNPLNVDAEAPFTLLPGTSADQPGALDTTTLADGEHSVLVEMTSVDGTTARRIATFTVANG